ncbi:MAG: hypothetical protein ACHQNV_05700 [Vicinamibacteria bacterium]
MRLSASDLRLLGLGASLLVALIIGCGGGGTSSSGPKPVEATVRVGSGITGRLRLAMSTSFQPAGYNAGFFVSQADVLILDSETDAENGPSPAALTPAPTLDVTLSGYGVAFVRLR